jgi:nucleotide-binding universal stress UspA family protein
MRVLVATDLSDAGLLSIEALIGCNPELFGGVTLVHAIELDHYTAGGSIPEITQWAEDRLAEEVANLTAAGFEADHRVEEGSAVEVVLAVAGEIAADLIMVTDRGKGGAAGRILGSTAERIAQAGEFPVLVVRVEERDAAWCRLGEGPPFARPLIAADLDQTFRRLALLTGRLPGLETARVVHVATPGADLAEAHGFIEAELAPTPIEHAEVVIVEGGDPAEAIVAEAQACEASLIVLAPRRHGLIGRIVFGSVALSLLRESRVALLFG